MGKHTPAWTQRMLVSEWKASGDSAGAFARKQGINDSTFRLWVKRHAPPEAEEPAFLEVVQRVPTPQRPEDDGDFVVAVDGHRLGFCQPPSPSWFASVLRELSTC